MIDHLVSQILDKIQRINWHRWKLETSLIRRINATKYLGQCLTNGSIITEFEHAAHRAILYIIAQLLSRIPFIHLPFYLLLSSSWLFPPARLDRVHLPCSFIEAPFLSLCLSVLATCACVYLQNLLATTQTWRRCPLFWLPCDVVLTVFRNKLEWQDAARCAASFSRPPLLTSICHCLPSWPAVIRTQFDDYCVTDKHQSRKLVDQFKFAPGDVSCTMNKRERASSLLARSLA